MRLFPFWEDFAYFYIPDSSQPVLFKQGRGVDFWGLLRYRLFVVFLIVIPLYRYYGGCFWSGFCFSLLAESIIHCLGGR